MRLDPDRFNAVRQWLAFVDPQHPVVRRLVEKAGSATELEPTRDPRQTLNLLLEPLRAIRWVGTQGWEAFEQAWDAGEGNCITLSALLVSGLQACGLRQSYVLVSGGGLLGQALVAVNSARGLLTAHAWAVVVLPGGSIQIIDPVRMEPEELGGPTAFGARLKLAAPVDQIWSMLFEAREFHLFAHPAACHAHIAGLAKGE
jgi:hypothetical protein